MSESQVHITGFKSQDGSLPPGFTITLPMNAPAWSLRTPENPVSSRLNGSQPLFALIGYDDIRTLEGRLLTLADATFQDVQQRKAFKDILRRTIWFDWANMLDIPDAAGNGVCGMPNLPVVE